MNKHAIALSALALLATAPAFANQQLAHYATVPAKLQRLEFNPFSLELTLWGLNIGEPGKEQVGFERLYTNVQADSLWTKALHLADVQLDKPKTQLLFSKDGTLNLTTPGGNLNFDNGTGSGSHYWHIGLDGMINLSNTTTVTKNDRTWNVEVVVAGAMEALTVTNRELVDDALLTRSPRILVMDLGGVGFMDSSGIGLILGRQRCARTLGGSLRIQHAPEQLRRVLQLASIPCTEPGGEVSGGI